MDILFIVTLAIIIAIGVLIYLIYNWVTKRKTLCGNDAFCYITGDPDTLGTIKNDITDLITKSINPF